MSNVTTVVSADSMDENSFLLHLAGRHPGSLAGKLPRFASDYLWDCYLAYHRQLHQFGIGLLHEHEES
jgi:hypothetical protein